MMSIQKINKWIWNLEMHFWSYNASPLMCFQFPVSYVSFNNAICAQSIAYPKNKFQLKIITATRYPSKSSIICTGDPNIVFYLMEI